MYNIKGKSLDNAAMRVFCYLPASKKLFIPVRYRKSALCV